MNDFHGISLLKSIDRQFQKWNPHFSTFQTPQKLDDSAVLLVFETLKNIDFQEGKYHFI